MRSSVRSRNVKSENCVCVERTAVGRMTVSCPITDRIGRATVSEQRPRQEISWIVIIRFIRILLLLRKLCLYAEADGKLACQTD